MSLICQCPAATTLITIPAVQCGENFGQIQKVAFQRLTQADGTRNSFTTTASILLKASWTAKLAATDGTKIVVSPFIEAPTSEPGAARTYGGGNDTLGGVETILGAEPTTFSAVLRRMPQYVIKIMKELMCEANSGNLGVYPFNQAGQIEALQDPTTETTYYPIPIRSLFISDKGHGGLEEPDINNISWSFADGYSDDLKIVTPTDFNPLVDLVPAT